MLLKNSQHLRYRWACYYARSADRVYELLTSTKPAHIASYSFGKPAAFLKAAEEVGLIDSLTFFRKSSTAFSASDNHC